MEKLKDLSNQLMLRNQNKSLSYLTFIQRKKESLKQRLIKRKSRRWFYKQNTANSVTKLMKLLSVGLIKHQSLHSRKLMWVSPSKIERLSIQTIEKSTRLREMNNSFRTHLIKLCIPTKNSKIYQKIKDRKEKSLLKMQHHLISQLLREQLQLNLLIDHLLLKSREIKIKF